MRLKFLAISLINLFTGVVEAFLGLRFVMKLFGANGASPFVKWIYDMSSVLLQPFRGIFPAKVLDNHYVWEFSTLFAMLMYAILALLLMAAVDVLTASSLTKKRR